MDNRTLEEVRKNETKLIEEIKSLEKQLEDANEKILLLQASEPMLNYKKSLEENQQKEFIEYLEDEIENSTFLKPSLEMILQKYKEIIGE